MNTTIYKPILFGYRIIVDKCVTDGANGVTVYGIEGSINGKVIKRFQDISPNRNQVEVLLDRLKRSNADPMFLRDFVEDYIEELLG